VTPASELNCLAGGVQVTDDDGNLAFACNGRDGADGAPGAPGTTGQGALTVPSAAGLTMTTVGASSDVQGLSLTVTVPSTAAAVVIHSDGSIRLVNGALNQGVSMEIDLFVDTNTTPTVLRRIIVTNTVFFGVTSWAFTIALDGPATNKALALTPGDHTFRVAAKYLNQSPSTAGLQPIVGDVANGAHRGTLTAMVINQ